MEVGALAKPMTPPPSTPAYTTWPIDSLCCIVEKLATKVAKLKLPLNWGVLLTSPGTSGPDGNHPGDRRPEEHHLKDYNLGGLYGMRTVDLSVFNATRSLANNNPLNRETTSSCRSNEAPHINLMYPWCQGNCTGGHGRFLQPSMTGHF